MQESGRFYGWWQGDALPPVPALPGLRVESRGESPALAHSLGLLKAEFTRRHEAGHRAYLALVDEQLAGYGWVASREAHVGELGVVLKLPAGNRYLWDFVTLPDWRGRGIYTRLLQVIIREESQTATRLWIGHDVDNLASERGIRRAGFSPVLAFGTDVDGHFKVVAHGPPERVQAARELWGL